MKLTTKRDRWYFWRELFSYMIPMILIVGTIDIFRNFMVCPLHPENSAPCSVIWIFAVMYGILLVLVIIFAIISARMLRKIKKKIEDEFIETANKEEKAEKSTESKNKRVVKKSTKVPAIKKKSSKK